VFGSPVLVFVCIPGCLVGRGMVFGVVSVSESVSVINMLDGGSKTIAGFVNGSSCCGL
jgi:hypothetical protein